MIVWQGRQDQWKMIGLCGEEELPRLRRYISGGTLLYTPGPDGFGEEERNDRLARNLRPTEDDWLVRKRSSAGSEENQRSRGSELLDPEEGRKEGRVLRHRKRA